MTEKKKQRLLALILTGAFLFTLSSCKEDPKAPPSENGDAPLPQTESGTEDDTPQTDDLYLYETFDNADGGYEFNPVSSENVRSETVTEGKNGVLHLTKTVTGINPSWYFPANKTVSSHAASLSFRILIAAASVSHNPTESTGKSIESLNHTLFQMYFGEGSGSPYLFTVMLNTAGDAFFFGDVQSTSGGKKTVTSDELAFDTWHDVLITLEVGEDGSFRAVWTVDGKASGVSDNFYNSAITEDAVPGTTVSGFRAVGQQRALFDVSLDEIFMIATPD